MNRARVVRRCRTKAQRTAPVSLASSNRSTQRAARSEPPGLLAGDRGDAVVVLVVVQDRDAGGLGGRRDQEIWMLDGSVVPPALDCELLVYEDHLRELPRAAHGVQRRRRQAREIAVCKSSRPSSQDTPRHTRTLCGCEGDAIRGPAAPWPSPRIPADGVRSSPHRANRRGSSSPGLRWR